MYSLTRCVLLSGLLTLSSLSCAKKPEPVAPPEGESSTQPAPSPHPLDAFTVAEYAQAIQLLREQGHVNENSVFPLVSPWEPSKEELDAFAAGTPVARRAFVVVYDFARNLTFEARVRLTPPTAVESWNQVPGVQPSLGTRDKELGKELVWQDERWRAAMQRRGVTHPEHIHLDTWAPGPSLDPQRADHRLMRIFPFFKGDSGNAYARPVEGVLALLDLTKREVVEVIDRGDIPIPQDAGAYDEASVGVLRPRPHPVVVTHPEGVNYTLTGNEVRWQNWRFRVEAHPREGAVLHQVTYTDQGRERKILHRLSLSEMVVPYGDPEDTWSWRSAFDVGEYGFGNYLSPLEPGVDVPASATFLPAAQAKNSGEVSEIPRALALYERDGGILWKHYDYETKRNESRRGSELVVAYGVAVANYDYVLYYIFKQDGSIDVDVQLTGIMLAKGMTPQSEHAEHELYGHLVQKDVIAVHHQHFFNFRLDFDVDGPRNSILEMNTHPLPRGAANPAGNAFTMRMEPLASEAQSQRDMSLVNARRWVIQNPQERNALGGPTGYVLVPGENTVPFAAPENVSRKRAGFIDHHFWATRHVPGELYAAGAYPNQSEGGDGLPTWVRDNQPLVNEDVVVWYTLGVTHTPRPEEWPVMPVAHAGFKLLPMGFFSRNPALDLPKVSTAPASP
ncbi:primary-amine oxidase [Melittangium boletus]|uniref:Amine oxidase n=1 Tax=Melittangium boletus DSM 14713 TaxID=1294270 RepID=A0A250IME0_9BACT|nr:primary-amine oxidase [Melittangium boletus]ATB32351.1 nickel transporter [Melittangium boletus DSM 14713]